MKPWLMVQGLGLLCQFRLWKAVRLRKFLFEQTFEQTLEETSRYLGWYMSFAADAARQLMLVFRSICSMRN